MNIKKISNISYIIILVFLDIITLFISFKLTIYVRINFFQDFLPLFNTKNIDKYYWIIFIIIIILLFEKIYFIRYDFWAEMKRIMKSLFLAFILCFSIIILSKTADEYSRSFIIFFFINAIFLLPLTKRYLKSFLFKKLKLFRLKIKIIAVSSQYNEVLKEINNNWYLGYIADKNDFDIIIISSKNFNAIQLEKEIKNYSKKTKDIYIIPYMYHLDFSYSNVVDYFNIRLSTIHLENRLLNFRNLFIKEFFEKVIVLSILPFVLILHIVIFMIIKLDSKGKVIYKQKRFGKNGKPFSCYKYRTMYENGDKILEDYLEANPEEKEYYEIYHKYYNDPRITKVGKFLRNSSLDEFPQFYNVLRGDMNLIGPRPYMLNEKVKIGRVNEEIILKIKPAITGLWQVSGRNELTFEKRIELDKWYIQNWSLWMDFIIFLKTIKVVLGKIGAK